MLISTWLLFHYIEHRLYSHTLERWKKSPNLGYKLVKLTYDECVAKDEEPPFDLPNKENVFSILSCLRLGSPKMRLHIRILCELVILRKMLDAFCNY
jgi:hypothetical protein